MIGTSARIGETVALRRMDVDVTTNPPTVLINGTLTQTRQNGLSRKPSPKRERQTRRVALPSFAAAAVRRRLAATEKGPGSYLFATQSGRPYSVSNYERLIRTFVEDNRQALNESGIAVDQFSSHLFRRTAATLVEAVAGMMTWFRQNVKRLRPEHRKIDPADRLRWEPGHAAQCDLWFPPRRIPLEDGTARLLPMLA